MRKLLWIAVTALACCLGIWGSDWPSHGGNPQRDGWAKFEKAFTKENVGGLQLLYTYKADNQARGLNALTAPIVNGLLITYLGFKEMLVFGGSSDVVYSVDADLNRLIWKTQFPSKAAPAEENKRQGSCSGGLTAALAMPGSSSTPGRGVGFRRVPVPPPGAPPVPAAGPPPLLPVPGLGTPVVPGAPGVPGAPAPPPPGLLATGFGRPGAFLALSSDGNLHVLNTATGEDRVPSIPFVPAGSNVSSLNVSDDTVYAATAGDCGGPNAVYAADLSTPTPKLASFPTNGSGPAGTLGTAVGNNGVVYVQVHNGHGDVAGEYNDTLVALASKTLVAKDYFTPATKAEGPGSSATPMVFNWNGKELLLTAGGDGSLYLLDSASLGGSDHHQPLFKTEPIGNVHGFAGWEDTATRTRWVYASVWGKSAHGGIAAFTVQEKDGHTSLVPAWTSFREITNPAPPVAANGLVLALSAGDSNKKNAHAILYALDGATGKELYSSQSIAKSFAYNGGLAVANRRIYFSTHDSTVYCFGFFADQLQLTGQ